MLKKQGYVQPDVWLYPIDPTVDYRLSENRHHMMMAWAEAMFHTGELNQQLRLMDWALEKRHTGDELIESKLWLAFLWGCCYNGTGPWTIISAFPTPPKSPEEFQEFTDWYNKNFERIRFDTDCRYRKSKMLACCRSYFDWLGDRTQAEAIVEEILEMDDANAKYETLKAHADSWKYYGRLSTWNYIEAVALVSGWDYELDCQDFLLTDVTGSESNRNGVAFIMERVDLVTKHGVKKESGDKITMEEMEMLAEKGEDLFQEIHEAFNHIDPVLRVATETIFCWMKKRFRLRNTRYIGWDEGRTYDEFKFIEDNWGDECSCDLIWEARKAWLPDWMLSENYPAGVERGSSNNKMEEFWTTGTPMDLVLFQQGKPWYMPIDAKPVKAKKEVKPTARRLF